MVEQTFYKGFEIRRHTFSYNGERRLIGYSVRKTMLDGTVVPYRRKSKNRKTTFDDTHFKTEQDAQRAIDNGEIREDKKIKNKPITSDMVCRQSVKRKK